MLYLFGVKIMEVIIMFCRKCGTQLPEDSKFCLKCGATTSNSTSPSQNNSITSPSFKPNANSMICKNCGKPLTTKWKHCPYCNITNPFYISSEPKESNPVQSQPQVIIQEREVIKPEEPGCATYIGRFVIGIFVLSVICSMLSQCGA